MKRWYFWVGLLVSVGFMYLALKGQNFPELWNTIQSASLSWLIPAVLVYFVDVWARSWRWHYLLRPVQALSTSEVFPIIAMGLMGNNVFPVRAGELLRAVVLKHRYEIPISTSLATILVERIFDGVVMLSFIIFNLSVLGSMSSASGFVGGIRSLALWGSIAFLGALAVFLMAAIFQKKAELLSIRIINVLLPYKWRAGATSIVRRFMIGLESLRSPKDTLMVFLSSCVIWLLETLTFWFVMRAFPIEVGFFALMLMNGIVNLSASLPSAPGYIGTFDAPGIALLGAFGIAPALAAGYTLVLHAALWLPITLAGGYFFAKEGINWSKELESARAERTQK
jgi:glycosyltransferase 2 family protein